MSGTNAHVLIEEAPLLVPAALEFGVQENVDQFHGAILVEGAGAKGEDVCVVVLP